MRKKLRINERVSPTLLPICRCLSFKTKDRGIKLKLRHWQNDELNRYTNYLICILMNINENIQNKRKMVEKIRRIPTKLPLHQLLTILSYKIWYPIKVEAKPFD